VPTILLLAPAALCALSWVGIGSLLPERWLPAEELLGGLTRIAFGSTAWSLALLALGRVGLFDRWLIVTLTCLAAVPGALAMRRVRWGRLGDRLSRVLLLAVAAALVLDLVAASAPPTSADALKYHLALPKLWLQTGSVGDPFWRWEGFSPSGVEMLFAQGLALGGGSVAAALHAVLAVLCALAVYGLGRELGGPLAGAAAAFLFVLQGIVTWEATSAFIELGLTFYAVLAVWHLVRGAPAWAGFCAGAALGTKYLGLSVALLVLVGLAVRRRPRELALAGGTMLAAGGAWYLKNLIVTGNPVYPLVFGGKWLTPLTRQQVHDSLHQYGLHEGLWRLPLLPIDLLVHGGAFDRGRYVGTAIFLLAVLALWTHRTRVVLFLWLGALAFVAIWWEESPQARFLLPALAVLAAVGGAGAAPWLQASGVRRVATVAVLAAAAAVWLVSSVALTRRLLPVTVGAESHAAFIQRLTGTYDALVAARARAGPGTIGVAGYDSTFNVPGRAISLALPEFDPSLSRTAYLARLASLHVRAILSSAGQVPELAPVRGCLRRTAVYHARFVTSRSLGHSVPYDLVLYSLLGCRR
jgi:hypothetical protein